MMMEPAFTRSAETLNALVIDYLKQDFSVFLMTSRGVSEVPAVYSVIPSLNTLLMGNFRNFMCYGPFRVNNRVKYALKFSQVLQHSLKIQFSSVY